MTDPKSIDAVTMETEVLRSMGGTLGPVYRELVLEVTWLHVRWSIHRELFGYSPERFELLRTAAPFFFYVLQGSLWEDLILGIARLVDPARSSGKDTLSVRALPVLVEEPRARAVVQQAVDASLPCCEFTREWRNRRLAHRELEVALGGGRADLPQADVARVEQALASLSEVLNSTAIVHGMSPTIYSLVSYREAGIDDLIDCLARGVADRNAESELAL